MLQPKHLSTKRRLLRGFGLLQVLLLLSVLSGLALIGYSKWRQRGLVDTARQEHQALAQADQAIITFATTERRLPCPDTNRDGVEDCTGNAQKGWLPVTSLRLAGADPGVDIGQLRYLVRRGGGDDDLTVLSDTWLPLEYDEDNTTFLQQPASAASAAASPASAASAANTDNAVVGPVQRAASDYYPDNTGPFKTLADLCQRISSAKGMAYASGQAAVHANPMRPVAYALVHPGRLGNSAPNSLFDGVNETAANEVEDPSAAPLLSTNDDVVLERSFDSLLSDFQCQPLIDSINLVALGEDVVNQVEDMRQDNIDDAKRSVAFAATAAILTGIETATLGVEVGSDGVNAALDFTICAATLGIAANACGAGPLHVAAAAATAGVFPLNATAIGLNTRASKLAGEALALADNSIKPGDLTCGKGAEDLKKLADDAQKNVDEAEQAQRDLETNITAKENQLQAAQNTRSSLIAQLVAAVNTKSASNNVNTLTTAADSWNTANAAFKEADEKLTSINQRVADWSDIANNYQDLLTRTQTAATLTNQIMAKQKQIDDLDARIKTETDAAKKSALQQQRSDLLKELGSPGMRQQIYYLDRQINIETDAKKKATLQKQRLVLMNALNEPPGLLRQREAILQPRIDDLNHQIEVLQPQIAQKNAAIAALDNQIKAQTNVNQRQQLEDSMKQLQKDLQQLQGQRSRLQGYLGAINRYLEFKPTPEIRPTPENHLPAGTVIPAVTDPEAEINKALVDATTELTKANAELPQARADQTAAQQTLNSANSSYQNAYNALLPAPTDAKYQAIKNAIAKLMGATSNPSGYPMPAADSQYFQPNLLQTELDGLKGSRSHAQDRVDAAKVSQTKAMDAVKSVSQDVSNCKIESNGGVGPLPPDAAKALLINVDQKGGIR